MFFRYYPNPWPNTSTGNPDLTWAVCVKTCPYILEVPPDMFVPLDSLLRNEMKRAPNFDLPDNLELK